MHKGSLKIKMILYAKQESSSQPAATCNTGRRGPLSSAEAEEGLSGIGMSCCRASAVSHRIPETLECLGRNSDMQPGPKATTRGAHEGQSLSFCQCLNWVVHFILNKTPWHIICNGFTSFTLFCGKLCFLFQCSK